MARSQPERRRTGRTYAQQAAASRPETRRWRAAVTAMAGPEETTGFEEDLAERLPPGLVAALPEVPVVTLFVAVSLARAGRRARDLRARFALHPAQARAVVRYATRGR